MVYTEHLSAASSPRSSVSLLDSGAAIPAQAALHYGSSSDSFDSVADRVLDGAQDAPSTKLNFPDDINDDVATGTLFSSSINICNTILGSGMLIIPLAMVKLGLGIGILLISISGFCAGYGLRVLANCGRVVGRKASFNALSKVTYKKIAVLFDIAIAVKCFGVSISYLIISGDLIPKAIRGIRHYDDSYQPAWLSRQVWILICVAGVSPFAFLRKLDALKYISTFAILSVFYLVIVVIYYFAVPTTTTGMIPHRTPKEITWARFEILDFLQALPMIVFAFTCHQNLYSVFNELNVNTSKRINLVINVSVGFAYVCYVIVGILGYLSFPDHMMTSNIIGQYPPNHPMVIAGQLAIVWLVLLAYPLQIHPSRASVDKVYATVQNAVTKRGGWRRVLHIGGGNGSESHYSIVDRHALIDSMQEIPRTRFLIYTVSLIVLSTFIACMVRSLSLVLGIVGATGSTTICYILPGLFYNKLLSHPEFHKHIGATRMTKYYARAMTIAGVIIMVGSLAGTILGAALSH